MGIDSVSGMEPLVYPQVQQAQAQPQSPDPGTAAAANQEGKQIPNETQGAEARDTAKLSKEDMVAELNQAKIKFESYNTRLEFSIHEKTKQIMCKVINSSTGEVIREVPPQKDLDLLAAILEKVGFFMDKKI